LTLRIGWIDYANCTPIFSTLRMLFNCEELEFVHGVPACLNGKLAAGEIDVCPASSFEYARSYSQYLIFPGLSISSIGPVKSVYLFSKIPLENLCGKTIALTPESETSIALLKILLEKYYGFSNRFFYYSDESHASALETSAAILLIGNTAMQWFQRRTDLYSYDLGELWFKETGLPFVFALWIIREQTALAKNLEASSLSSRLRVAKEVSLTRLEQLVDECGERSWIDRGSLVSYWRTISYDLGQDHLRGVSAFYRDAKEIGLLDNEPQLRFFESEE
jgi:chorismate dehydratase